MVLRVSLVVTSRCLRRFVCSVPWSNKKKGETVYEKVDFILFIIINIIQSTVIVWFICSLFDFICSWVMFVFYRCSRYRFIWFGRLVTSSVVFYLVVKLILTYIYFIFLLSSNLSLFLSDSAFFCTKFIYIYLLCPGVLQGVFRLLSTVYRRLYTKLYFPRLFLNCDILMIFSSLVRIIFT